MKNILLGLAFAASLSLSSCSFGHKSGSISISTQDNGSELNFKANYPEEKTAIAQSYIESNLKEERIFGSANDIKKVEIKLTDGTQFYLNYEPGFISINFERNKNSFTSYNRMKKMIAGFGNAIKDK